MPVICRRWPESGTAAGDWGAAQFLPPYLCEKFAQLRDGELFLPVTLGSVAHIEPAGQRTRESFTRSAMPDAEGRVALWQLDTEVTQSMATKWDSNVVAKPPRNHLAERYWQQRGRLLLSNRMRWLWVLRPVEAHCAALRHHRRRRNNAIDRPPAPSMLRMYCCRCRSWTAIRYGGHWMWRCPRWAGWRDGGGYPTQPGYGALGDGAVVRGSAGGLGATAV